jgi:DNA-binding SARP family transcriptional activator
MDGAAGELAALLAAAGHAAAAARVASVATLGDADVVEIAAMVAAKPFHAVGAHRLALLELARAAELTVHNELRADLLRRAADLARDDQAVALEIEAEIVRDLARDGEADAAERRGATLVAQAGPDDSAALARTLDALGNISAWRATPTDLAQAERYLAEAAGLAGAIGRPDWRARSLLCLGYRVHFDRGEFDRAAARLTEAVALLPETDRLRAVLLTFLGEVALARGSAGELANALTESAAIGRRLGDQRLLAYAAWAQAKAAAVAGDQALTMAWLEETERHPGDWFEHPTGIEFLADAATMADRVGETQAARRYLARADERATEAELPELTLFATGALAARSGDPNAAEAPLLAALDSPELPPREVWRVHLLRALAAWRAGDRFKATQLAAAAFASATAIGVPELPNRLESAAVAALAPVLERGSTAAPRAAVTVLGGFAASIDGADAHLPEGKPAQLVKLLAAAGRTMPIDEALEVLWPGADSETARRRLRNVLTRVKAAAGDLVIRRGDQLALGPEVVVDATTFVRAAEAALAVPAESRAPFARAALAHHAGELLPADRYEDWASTPRERIRGLALSMLGALADEAERAGDLAEAVDVVARMADLDPLDERHPVRAARMLTAARQPSQAAVWARRARKVCEDLDIPEPPEVAAALA